MGANLKTAFRRNSGSFTTNFAYINFEIHKVFLQFLSQNLRRNFSPTNRKSVLRIAPSRGDAHIGPAYMGVVLYNKNYI